MDPLRAKLDALQSLNLTLRKQLEAAEHFVAPINAAIGQLHAIERLPELILPGPMIGSRPYSAAGPVDSEQVLQAALDVPRGIGVIRWDSNDGRDMNGTPEDFAVSATRYFVSFHELTSAEKALLLPVADELLNQLFESLRQRLDT